MTQPGRLIHMANQIARAFAYLERRPDGEAQAVAAVSGHLRAYWDPRMRAAILAQAAHGDSGLDPVAQKAIEHLRAAQTA